jgi:transposase InsO family protein
MPWKGVSLMETKLEFIHKSQAPGVNFSHLCKSYGISRKTGYALLKKYVKTRDAGLECRSRKPNTSPTQTSDETIAEILEVRRSNPYWGGRKIRKFLINHGHEMPSEKTINRILHKYGCINPEESAKRKAFIRFEHKHPNDLWQMDFKGHFKTGEVTCHPLTLLDDHSRYSLAIQACSAQKKDIVKQALINVFRQYGLPNRMTMDNGSPWGYATSMQRYTELNYWLIRLGIKVSHSRPYHPQTQGKLERFHRTMKLELLKDYYFENLENAQAGFDWWRRKYNEQRPHEAIGLDVPKDRYQRSTKEFPEILPPLEFPDDTEIRCVSNHGDIDYKGLRYRVGRGLKKQKVGIKECEENDKLLDVYYSNQKVLQLVKAGV